jgi:site-specific DNA recombinase
MGQKRIGIWVRVSSPTSVQKENHIHHEMRAKAFIKQRGWKVEKIYRLKGMTGKSIDGYDETQEMMDDIKNNRIDGLVFTKIARLARNTSELINIAKFFREHDADLISMDMSIDTSTPIGRHFFRTMSSMAEWELEMITERIQGSVLSRAERGLHIGGQAPFGFKYENRKLVPDPEEAPVRKLMFELFLEHKRKKTVARILNEKGYRTKKGNKFTDSTVKRLLTDPVAKGLHIMNRRYSKNRRGKGAFKPKEEWFFHEVEPIVSEELWDQVNDLIKSQKRRHKQVLNTKVHLFTGFVFCECGSPMYTRYNSENYVCHKSCGNLIRKDDLEEIFRSELHSYTVSEKNIDHYFKRLKVILKDREKQLGKLKTEKERLNKHIENILLLHTEGKIPTEAFHSYHQKPYEQLQQVSVSIEEIEQEIQVNSVTKKSTNEVLELAKDLFEKWTTLSHEQKREVIETITDKIIVGKDEIDITLFKILPDRQPHPFFENKTNGQHTTNGMMWISKWSFCN